MQRIGGDSCPRAVRVLTDAQEHRTLRRVRWAGIEAEAFAFVSELVVETGGPFPGHREEAVGDASRTPRRRLAVAAEDDGRIRLLDRPRRHGELDAVASDRLTRPRASKDVDVFFHQARSVRQRTVEEGVLGLSIPAGEHGVKPTVADDVNQCHLFRRIDGVVQRQEVGGRGEQHVLRAGGSRCEEGER